MTLWVAYVPAGQEFALVEDCEVLGIEAVAPRKVEAVRTGNKRWPEPRITPYLPNYAFVTASATEWHWLREIRYVRDLMGVIPQWVPSVRAFIETVEGQFAARMAEIEAAQRVMQSREATKEARRAALASMAHYQPSDMLEVITGPFAGALAVFRRMVEGSTLAVEVEIGAFGKVLVDPLAVKRAG